MARGIGTIRWYGPDDALLIVERGTNADGSRRVRRERFRGTEDEARARCAVLAMEMGREPARCDGMTLSTFYWGVFRASDSVRGKPRSANTLRWYDEAMRPVLDRIGDRPVASITHAEAADAIRSCGSPANAKTSLRAVLRSAYDHGLLEEMPMTRRIPTHRERMPQREPWSLYEVSQALSRIDRPDLMAYCVLGLSGLRMEECLALRPCDLSETVTCDFVTGEETRTMTATVRRTYTDRGGLVDETKNPQSRRVVPVFYGGREALRRYVEGLRSDDPEWAERRLIPQRADALYRKWRRMCKRCGLRFIPPSMLRHTSDTIALAAGVDPQLNAKMHGRTDPATAYRHYYRPGLGLQEEAARKVGGASMGACGGVWETDPGTGGNRAGKSAGK